MHSVRDADAAKRLQQGCKDLGCRMLRLGDWLQLIVSDRRCTAAATVIFRCQDTCRVLVIT